MPKVACFMMQKNEQTLLEPWLIYHGHLFGFENLYVWDTARLMRQFYPSSKVTHIEA